MYIIKDCFDYIHIYVLCAHVLCPEEVVGSHGTEVTECCEPPCGYIFKSMHSGRAASALATMLSLQPVSLHPVFIFHLRADVLALTLQ